MEKQALIEAIQEAVRDYNLWWERNQDAARTHPYGELRGILYNKILTRLRGVPGFAEFCRNTNNRALETTDIDPCFEWGMLQDIKIQVARVWCNGDVRRFLTMMAGITTDDIIYDMLPDDASYKMVSIVNKIKAYKI